MSLLLWVSIWLLMLLSVYSYFIYPLILLALRSYGKRKRDLMRQSYPIETDQPVEPAVSLIITAYNEEEKIQDKIANSLAIDYPSDKLEIVVASDASTDGTETIARGFPEVTVVTVEKRKGKEHAQREAIRQSRGEILVFTDVGTLLDPGAVKALLRNFLDPQVGAISSTDVVLEARKQGSGEGLYVRYEMVLRRLESEVNSLVGLSGSFFAARRSICEDWAVDLPSDFNTVLNCIRNGYRAISDENVIGYYKSIRKGQSEFNRKVRTLVRGITAFNKNMELLNFNRYGLFSFQLLSHKLMRWLVPFFLILLLLLTLARMLAGDPGAYTLLALQALFYGLAYLGFKYPSLQRNPFVKVAFFFAQANLAILVAWIRYAKGERILMWNPSQR